MVEEAASVGQQYRSGMLDFLPGRVDFGDRRRLTARFGHAQHAGVAAPKRITPSGLHAPSRNPPGILAQRLRRTTGHRHLLQPSRKPVHAEGQEPAVGRPDRTGLTPSVPASGRASSTSNDRTHRSGRPSGPGASNATLRPSGDNTPVLQNGASAGAGISKRTGVVTGGCSRKCTQARPAAAAIAIAATPIAAAVSIGLPEGGTAPHSPAAHPPGPPGNVCRATRASPMSRSRAFTSRSRQRRSRLERTAACHRAAGRRRSRSAARRPTCGTRLAVKQARPRQHLPQHHAERPDVGALVHRLGRRLLRGHVAGGPENHARPRRRQRQRRRVRGIGCDGPRALRDRRQAEVEHLDGAIGPHLDVGRFHIAVDDALLVRGFERLGDLSGDVEGFVDRDGALRDAIRQRRAFHQLHHERDGPVRFLEAVDRGDVGMIQRRQDFRFALEARQPLRVTGDRSRQHLDGDLSLQVRIGGPIHHAHAAGAKRRGDFVRTKPCSGFLSAIDRVELRCSGCGDHHFGGVPPI